MINFTFSIDELNAILGNLGKLSYQDVFTLIDSIRNQALPQVKEINDAKATEEASNVAEEVTPILEETI